MSNELAAGVVVHAYPHALGDVACTSYVTTGLRAFGQRELVMTMTRGGPEPVPLLRAIAGFAEQGTLVDDGGRTEVGPNGLFGRPELRGVVYQHAWPMDGVPVPPDALAMIMLVGHEMQTATDYGALRVLARLGRAHRFFPTAVWCDVTRGPLFPPESGTVLENVARGSVNGLAVVVEGDDIVLRAPRSALTTFANLPPPDLALALLTTIAPDADSCLVWTPGQRAPEAIAFPGSTGRRTSGCFVAFVPQQDADAANVFEDGVVCMLTDASWARVRQALATGTPLTIPGTRALSIVWI